MASLTAHLLETGDHGRLGFHANCPVCRRERLFGALPSEPVISRRTQAVLAAGALALSAVAPSTSVAQEQDTQQEGAAAPEHPGGATDGLGPGGPDAGPQVDPSGEAESDGLDPGAETALPFEVGAPPVAPPPSGGDDDEVADSLPLEAEPTEDPDAHLFSLSELDPNAPLAGEDAPTPPAEALPAPTPLSPPTLLPFPAPLPLPAESRVDQAEPGIDARREMVPAPLVPPLPVLGPPPPDSLLEQDQTSRAHGPQRAMRFKRTPRSRPVPPIEPARARETARPIDLATSSGPPTSVPPNPIHTTELASAEPIPAPRGGPRSAAGRLPHQQTSSAPHDSGSSSPRHGRAHVVQPGESLWSIAKGLIGPGASPARIARKVHRLWTLNHDRIGTGDPDLLMVGTTLRLP